MVISSTTVRKNGQSLRGYIAIFKGALVLTATVTANAGILSAKTLSISISLGSIANVQRGYRVQVFSSTGAFKGETHVRWGGTLDGTHLPVREFSQSEFLIFSGDVVKVFALMAFADKLVEDTDLFDPDGVPVGAYNSAPPPLACSGGYDAGFVDGYETGTVQTYRTTLTYGVTSRILDPTSNITHIAHLWTLVTGVTFAPGSANTDANPILRVNVGEYTIYHDVTDTDNGQTWRQCVTYQVFDKDHLPVSVMMEAAPTGAIDQGWNCSFRAIDFLSLTDAPDGSLAMFFVRERINNTWQSLGGSYGRAAVKVVGYLSHDESDIIGAIQIQRFDMVSPLTRLGQLPGFSKILIQNATADDWSRMTALDTLRAKIELIRIYTFALDGGHDLLISFFYNDQYYPELWLQKESPLQQVNELADGVDARFTCTRNGLFRLDPIPQLIPPATRLSLTPVYTFAQRDVVRLVARRDHFDTIETLELHATASSSNGNLDESVPVFSRAPGSPGQGAEYSTIERIIADVGDPQRNANERAGRRYAWRNGVYTDSATGVKARAPEIDLEMREAYDFLDFDDQIVLFDSFPNPRDVDLTFFLWTLTKVSLDYTTGKVITTFSPLTDSPPGATYVPPGDPLPASSTPLPPPIVVTTPNPGIYGRNMAELALFNSDGQIYYVAHANYPSQSGGALVTDVGDLSSAGLSGTLNDFTVDAFSPNYITAPSGAVNGWIVTDAEIRQMTDIFGTFTLNTATTFSPPPGAGTVVQMDFERGEPNWGLAAFYSVGNGTYIVTTSDGVTFTQRLVTANYNTLSNGSPPGVYVNPHAAGEGYVSAYVGASGPAVASGLYRITGHGSSITHITNPNVQPGVSNLAVCLVVPLTNIGDTVFYALSNAVTSVIQLMRVIGNGSPVDISPSYGGDSYGPLWANRSLSISPTNPNVAVLCGWNNYQGMELTGVWRTENLMAAVPTWTLVVTPTLGAPWRRAYVSGDDPAYTYLLGVGGYFGVMIGNSLDDRSAALRAAYPGAGEFVGLCGVRRS